MKKKYFKQKNKHFKNYEKPPVYSEIRADTKGQSRMKKKFFLLLPVIVYCALIFLQSAYIPDRSLPHFPFLDKIMHLGGYAILGALIARVLFNGDWSMENRKVNKRTIIIIAILFSAMYGISDEIHQSFVAARHGDIFDVIADAAGSTMGVLFFIKCRRS